MIPIAYKKGIHLPEADLWLDPRHSQPHSIVTHAHADHVAAHRLIICTPRTAAIIRARYRYKKSEIHPLDYHTPHSHRGHTIRLLPAGHILGSAMVHITRESDGATLLYTGDFKLRAGHASEAARPAPADQLIMESTFGLPRYTMPPTPDVHRAIHRWCQTALADTTTPVLLAYSLGKSQELIAMLGAQLPIYVHSTIAKMNTVYEEQGWPLPPWQHWTGQSDGVVLLPPQSQNLLAKLPRHTTAMVTGWALDPAAPYRYHVAELFPLSDHADYPDLLQLIRLVQPRHILTTHGFSEAFAADLRQRGHSAWSLAGTDQTELSLDLPLTTASTPPPEPPPAHTTAHTTANGPPSPPPSNPSPPCSPPQSKKTPCTPVFSA